MRGLIENTNFSRPSVRTQGHYIDMLSILSPQFRRDTARRRRASERVARSRCRLRANEIMAPVVVTHPIIELLIFDRVARCPAIRRSKRRRRGD